MTNSYSSSNSHSYSESEIKEVLGKVYDDFHALDARGFDFFTGDYLKGIRDDLYFLLTKNALIEFQIKFNYDGKTVAIHYKVNPFGSIINSNKPSGGTDYYEFPKTADVKIVLSRKQDNPLVNTYMTERGWTPGGKFFTGVVENKGDYSKGNLGINRSIIR